MNKTRVIFFVILGIALLIVVAGLVITQVIRNQPSSTTQATPIPSDEPIQVRVVAAIPIESWVNEAAKAFNAEDQRLDGRPIEVTIIPMDGLTAMEDVTIQSLFTGGPEGNFAPEHVSAWVEQVVTIAPVFVQVYTLDRASPTKSLLPLDKSELLHIKSLLEKENIAAGVY